ncbi:MAG: hypothetical protein AABZ60_20840 [Planctomycetota bacterium]
MRGWAFNPNSGGTKIPDEIKKEVEKRLLLAAKIKFKKDPKLRVRFKNQFCYVDSNQDSVEPVPLCRLRYSEFKEPKAWSIAFFAYSSEKYEPCVYPSGEWHGTPEEALDVVSVYLS